MTSVEHVWNAQAELGEGPTWVPSEESVYWLDIMSNRVLRYHIHSGEETEWLFGERITSLSHRLTGGFVATTKNGFVALHFDDCTTQEIHFPAGEPDGNRFNDGKVDASGRYWAGSMDDAQREPTGSLYCLDENLLCSVADDGYIITNGPTFSKDGTLMYHTDSPRQCIYVFDVNAKGQLENKREFLRFSEDMGYPDGMTVDSEDCLWVAQWSGSGVSRFSPEGELLAKLDVPASNVTSCVFAGDDLESLYITTARTGLSDQELAGQPLAGSLFRCRPGVTGLATTSFAG